MNDAVPPTTDIHNVSTSFAVFKSVFRRFRVLFINSTSLIHKFSSVRTSYSHSFFQDSNVILIVALLHVNLKNKFSAHMVEIIAKTYIKRRNFCCCHFHSIKNLVWHSHNFLLPYITTEEYFFFFFLTKLYVNIIYFADFVFCLLIVLH